MKRLTTKKITTMMMAAVIALSAAFMTGCGNDATSSASKNDAAGVENMTLSTNAVMLAGAGAEYDLNAAITVEPEGAEAVFTFASSDEAVVTVSEDGVITAVADGTATVTVSVADTEFSASLDVAVCDYTGTYSGTKSIEAMGCDITVDMTLNADGTYTYYRAPMMSSMTSDTTGLEDAGTFVMNGSEIVFTGAELGEFTLTLTMENGVPAISGKIPTGGPSTELVLNPIAE